MTPFAKRCAMGTTLAVGMLLVILLNAAYPQKTWEIINTGVPGYNTVMEVATMRAKGLALEPDIVILNVVTNDLNLPTRLLKRVRSLLPHPVHTRRVRPVLTKRSRHRVHTRITRAGRCMMIKVHLRHTEAY